MTADDRGHAAFRALLAAPPPPPVFDADYPGEQRRSLLFLRLILFWPHYVIIAALNYAVGFTTIVVWFAILFTGRRPQSLFDFGALYLRWYARLMAYMLLLTDQYPPFGDGPYPAQLVIVYGARASRLTTFFRYLLALPAIVAVVFLSFVVQAVVILAWFAILIWRRCPLGLHGYLVGYLRWWLRLSAYLLLLTDDYPPFQLNQAPPAAAPLLPEGVA